MKLRCILCEQWAIQGWHCFANSEAPLWLIGCGQDVADDESLPTWTTDGDERLGDKCQEPTNNLAEHAIWFVAIQRRITQGTRSPAGQTWCERIWTAVATCEPQGRSLFDYLVTAVTVHFAYQAVPSLLVAIENSE